MPTREHILGEIRRLAQQAGGKPPGKRIFESETGIKESDWSGRIWARWGDAVAEAGFQPNTRPERIAEDDVLTAIIGACRHYGHVPTVPELQLYKRGNPSFPSKNVVYGRFPTRAALVAALAERAASDDTCADVGAMVAQEPPRPPQDMAQASPAQEGHVYLLQSGTFYKVGRSADLERRVREVRVALPEAVSLVHAIRTDDPPGIEAYWHRRFAARRRNGEWFALTPQDVAAFRRRRYQ